MSKFKKITCVFLLSLIILNYATVCCNANTNRDNKVSLLMDGAKSNSISLYEDNGKIVVRIYMTASSDTTYEGGILTLRRTVGSNTVFLENLRNLSSSTSVYSYYNNSHDAVSGTYIVKFAIYAVKNGVRERVNLEKTLVVWFNVKPKANNTDNTVL